ncbi:MAG: proton-conducting transporter membrane subunit [Thermoplasmata archaeon]
MFVLMVIIALAFALILLLSSLLDLSRRTMNILFLAGILSPIIVLVVSNTPYAEIMGGWNTVSGIEIRIVEYNLVFLMAELIVFSIVGIYAVSYYKDETKGHMYFPIILVMHGAMMGVFMTNDLFNLFVLMELVSVSAFALVALSSGKNSQQAAFRYLLFSLLTSYLFLLSIGIIYAKSGYLNFELIAQNIGSSREVDIAVGMAFVAMILKTGIFPLHFWLPDVYSESDTPICALLAGMTRRAPIYAMLMFTLYLPMNSLSDLLLIVAFASIFFGTVMALFQNDVWRLLAYTSIGLMGIVLVGIATGNTMGVAYYVFAHAIVTTGLFLTTGNLSDLQGTRNVRDLTYHKDVIMFSSIAILSFALGSLSPSINAFAKAELIKGLSGYSLILFQASFVMALLVMLKMNYLLWHHDDNKPRYRTVNIRSLVSAIPAVLLVSLGLYLYPTFALIDLLVIITSGALFFIIVLFDVLEYEGVEKLGVYFKELGTSNNYYSMVLFVFLVLILIYTL